jgi:hypothetical protein
VKEVVFTNDEATYVNTTPVPDMKALGTRLKGARTKAVEAINSNTIL